MFNKKERKLMKYIKNALSQGKSKEKIKDILLQCNWKEQKLDSLFDLIEKKENEKIELKIPLKFKKKEVPQPEETEQDDEEKKPAGIKQRLDNLEKTFDVVSGKNKATKKFKKKRFKIPFKAKAQLKKLAVKNKVQVMLLQRTRNIKPIIGEIKEGMLLVGDQIYNGSVNSTWLWNGKYPTHIVPEWDLQPLTPDGITHMQKQAGLSPEELYEDCIRNKRSAEPQKIIIRAMEAKQSKLFKGSVSTKAIITTIIITIIVAAVLFGGGLV